MFRTVLFLAALALCAFMAGWFTIDRNEQETTIRFDRDEIRADASKALSKGREILKANENRLDQDSAPQPPLYSDPYGVPSEPVPQQANRPIPPWEQPQQRSPGTPPVQY